jgi:hypothetical protein
MVDLVELWSLEELLRIVAAKFSFDVMVEFCAYTGSYMTGRGSSRFTRTIRSNSTELNRMQACFNNSL